MSTSTIVLWVSIALLATVLGSAGIARLINRPLKDLSFAASRIREGEYDSRLDETTMTSEIRQVNMGFNRMARELRQGRAGPRRHARRHLARPAHAAVAAAPRGRDERPGRGGQGEHGDGHRPARRDHRQVHGLRAAGRGAGWWRSNVAPDRRRGRRLAFRDTSQIRITVEGGARDAWCSGRRRRARPGAAEPVRERASLRPLDGHGHRPGGGASYALHRACG